MWPVSKRIWTSSHLRGITTGWPKSLFLGGTAVAISFLWVPPASQIAHISKHELLEQSTFWAAGPHSKQQQLACTPFITYTVVISWPVSISLLSCMPRGSGQLSVCVWIFPCMQVLWADIRYFHQYTGQFFSFTEPHQKMPLEPSVAPRPLLLYFSQHWYFWIWCLLGEGLIKYPMPVPFLIFFF